MGHCIKEKVRVEFAGGYSVEKRINVVIEPVYSPGTPPENSVNTNKPWTEQRDWKDSCYRKRTAYIKMETHVESYFVLRLCLTGSY